MDTGKGTFEQVQADNEGKFEEMKKLLEGKHPNHGGWFREGDIVQINGSTFRVKSVKPNELRLKLLPRQPAGT